MAGERYMRFGSAWSGQRNAAFDNANLDWYAWHGKGVIGEPFMHVGDDTRRIFFDEPGIYLVTALLPTLFRMIPISGMGAIRYQWASVLYQWRPTMTWNNPVASRRYAGIISAFADAGGLPYAGGYTPAHSGEPQGYLLGEADETLLACVMVMPDDINGRDESSSSEFNNKAHLFARVDWFAMLASASGQNSTTFLEQQKVASIAGGAISGWWGTEAPNPEMRNIDYDFDHATFDETSLIEVAKLSDDYPLLTGGGIV